MLHNTLRIVFQVEEKPLLRTNGTLNRECIDLIAMILTNCSNSEKEVILVSAGAIAAGIEKMGLKINPKSLTEKQAIAAIGQVELIRRYQNIFDEYNQMIAQVLLDRNVIDSPGRKKNAQNTFLRLLQLNVIPVINENDTTSTEDIEQENNYPLTATVAEIADAHIIVSLNEDFSFKCIVSNSSSIYIAGNKDKLFQYLTKIDIADIEAGKFPSMEELSKMQVAR